MKKISKEIFKVNYINFFTLVFSNLLGVILIFSNNFIYKDNFYAKYSEVVINNVSVWEIILFLVISIIIYILISTVSLTVYKKHHFFEKSTRKISRKNFLTLFLLFILAWTPYLLSYYPGAVYSDAFTSMTQALSFKINNHHTILYSSYLSLFAYLGKILDNYNIAIFLYTIIQYLFMIFVLATVIKWLYNRGLKSNYLVFILVIFLFCPLFPYYAIAVWKDTFFSLFLLLYIMFLIDYLTGRVDFKKKINIAKFLLLSFFVCFLRNNGIYIVVFTLFCIFAFDMKNIKKNKLFLIVDISFVILTFIIQGPIYSKLKLSTEYVEQIAIPMQQVGAIVSTGRYSKDDVKTISRIWNLEEVKEKYTPYLADTMKWYMDSYDGNYLIAHRKKFIIEWLKLIRKNKDIAFKMDNYSTYKIDACIVATHMMLEATNLGIDNIWIEMFDKKKLKQVFNLEDNIEPICLLPIGYRSDDCPKNPLHNVRKNLDEIVIYC